MYPRFLLLGILAILFQVSVIGAFYGYHRWRNGVPSPDRRSRSHRLLASGTILIVLGQVVAVGAPAVLETTAAASVNQSIMLTNAGAIGSLLGYGLTIVGFVVYGRDGT